MQWQFNQNFDHMQGAHMDDKTHQSEVISMLEALSHLIDRISCEVYVSYIMLCTSEQIIYQLLY